MGMFSIQTVPNMELEIPRSRCYIKQFPLLILQAAEIMAAKESRRYLLLLASAGLQMALMRSICRNWVN
jgi:hypothetical protein